MLQARELIPRRFQQQPQAILVGHLGTVYLGFKHQSLRVYQQVTLSAFYLLGGIEAAFVASHSRGPDRLGVHNPGARVRVPTKVRPQPFAQLGVKALPSPVEAPPPEPVVDGLPRWEVSR